LSLIRIHKESIKGEGVAGKFKGVLNIHKSQHFARLRQEKKSTGFAVLEKKQQKEPEKPKPKEEEPGPKYVKLWHEPKNMRKDLMLMGVIAAVVIFLILAELSVFSGRSSPSSGNETNEPVIPIIFNNTTTTKPKPDLDIKSLSLSKTKVEIGDKIEIDVSIKNIGKANATNVTVSFLVGNSSLAIRKVGLIAVDDTTDLRINWTALASQKGQQIVKVSVDPEDKIDEISETNNEESKTVTVTDKIVQDITATFKLQSTEDFNKRWYSEKFRQPPKSGEDYIYFQITQQSASDYYLDVSIPGFRATSIGKVAGIEIPDASDSGWNSHWCIKETMSDDTCIWNGPEIAFSFEFKSGKLTVEDAVGVHSTTFSSGKKIKDITLIGMKKADWPGNLTTWGVTNAPKPNNFVPKQFYEYYNSKLYIHPMVWNPKALEAEVTTWLRFDITTG